MRVAARVLAILGLVLGIIWSIIGFFGAWFGGGLLVGFQSISGEVGEATKTFTDSAYTMIYMLIGFLFLIPGGIFGITGSSRDTLDKNRKVLALLCLLFGLLLMILNNYIAGLLYISSGFILLLIKNSRVEKKYGIEELKNDLLAKYMNEK